MRSEQNSTLRFKPAAGTCIPRNSITFRIPATCSRADEADRSEGTAAVAGARAGASGRAVTTIRRQADESEPGQLAVVYFCCPDYLKTGPHSPAVIVNFLQY